MNIQKNNLNIQSPSFSGHRKTLDKYGYEQHNFYYLYDSSKYDCEVELYNLNKDAKGNFSKVENSEEPAVTLPMRDGGIVEDLTEYDELDLTEGFAYRFKLTEKANPDNVSYGFDNGTVIGIFDNDPANKFNVVLSNRAMINKNGAMQLIMPDEYFPGVDKAKDSDGKYKINKAKRAKAEKAVRNHANKLGGKFIGIIKRLPELQAEGVKRIVGTPFTKDTISSHLYWTENAYQVAPNLGTEEDFKELQVELFKNGINWIADAALVNEGFGGIHLSETLRKNENGFSKNMFRSDERIALGILPDNAEKKDFTRMKIINAPVIIAAGGESLEPNPDYDAKKPTYIQFYDKRLASEDQKKSQSPARMTTYDNTNTKNVYDITKHDDAVYPFPIEVSPTELERNLKREIKNNGRIFNSAKYPNTINSVSAMKRIADFSNFSVVNKEKAGGLEVWDGNVDIAKLNFYRSRHDYSRFADLPAADRAAAVEAFDKGALAVRDYALNSGKYWTQLTADTQMQYVSKYLAENADVDYMSAISKGIKEGALPKSTADVIDADVIKNIQNGKYNLRRLNTVDARSELSDRPYDNKYSVTDYAMKKAMDLPLETLPVATNLLGILTSPYIGKKANAEEELGISRFDLSSAGNPNLPQEYASTYERMDNIYANIADKIETLVLSIDGVRGDDGNISDYGRYVISEMAPDLTKYLLLKSISPDADVRIDSKGNFDFSNVKQEDITMQALGITYDNMTSKEEAQVVLQTLESGINDVSLTALETAVKNRFEGRTLDDFRIAEAIIDRTESGLGWRIDAAKDIASIDAIRAGVDSVEETWDKVIDFWKIFNQSVLQINPHAYTTAEITDLPDLFNWEEAGLSDAEKSQLQEKRKYMSPGDAERKFLEETGITSLANYNYFFSLMPELFALNKFEDGGGSWMSAQEMNHELRNKLDDGWQHEIHNNPGFLFNSPADGVENSYTFFGNHDKPRPLHCLALDMGLFNSDFAPDKKSSYENKTHRTVAAEVLQQKESEINFDKVNPMAIAMGQRLNGVLSKVMGENEEIAKSIAKLATGSHKGSEFDPTAFGTRPFDVAIDTVFDETEYRTGEKIKDRETIKAEALKEIMVPAYDRYKSMYKLLLSLPGSPTDFAGDRVGTAGYETKAKNYHQQNRNTIHWEWLEDSKYSFVKTIYDDINAIANLRNKPELSALNDGATLSVPVKVPDGKDGDMVDIKVQSMIRYNHEGSVVISLHDLTGASATLDKPMSRGTGREISDDKKRLYFQDGGDNSKRGLKSGLEVGSVFKNALDLDEPNSPYYEVGKDDKGYYLQKKKSVATSGGPVQQAQPIVIEPRDLNTLLLCKVK